MPKRYFIGNPRTILKPDACAHILAVNSWQSQTNRVRKLSGYHDSRCEPIPESAKTNTLIPIPESDSHLVNMIRDTYTIDSHLIFVPETADLTVDDPTAICFEVPDSIFPFVGIPGWNSRGMVFTITLHLCFHGRVFATSNTKLMKGFHEMQDTERL